MPQEVPEDNFIRDTAIGTVAGAGAGALLGEYLGRDERQEFRTSDHYTKQAVGHLLELEISQDIHKKSVTEPDQLKQLAIDDGNESIKRAHAGSPRNWLEVEHLKAYRAFENKHDIVGRILDSDESAKLLRYGDRADLRYLKPGTFDEIAMRLESRITRENIPYEGLDKLRSRIEYIASHDYGMRELSSREHLLQNLSRRSTTGLVAGIGAALGFMGTLAYETYKPRRYF